jgi:hypothetical protein
MVQVLMTLGAGIHILGAAPGMFCQDWQMPAQAPLAPHTQAAAHPPPLALHPLRVHDCPLSVTGRRHEGGITPQLTHSACRQEEEGAT